MLDALDALVVQLDTLVANLLTLAGASGLEPSALATAEPTVAHLVGRRVGAVGFPTLTGCSFADDLTYLHTVFSGTCQRDCRRRLPRLPLD